MNRFEVITAKTLFKRDGTQVGSRYVIWDNKHTEWTLGYDSKESAEIQADEWNVEEVVAGRAKLSLVYSRPLTMHETLLARVNKARKLDAKRKADRTATASAMGKDYIKDTFGGRE